MAVDNITRIEERIDRTAAGATDIRMDMGGIQFKSMIELMEFAKLMAVSGAAVPIHLRGNPGACLAICTRALRFGFDPFSLAEHSYAMEKSVKNESGQWEKVETIAYDSFVLSAIINAHAPLTGRIDFLYFGDGDLRKCKAFATPRGASKVLEHESPALGDLKKMRGRNDKGQIKGSQLWDGPKSDQQLAYDTRRDFCRKYFPEVLLGWYDKEEMEAAQDVTPAKPDVGSRLSKKTGARGFSESGVAAALAHTAGETLPEAKPAEPATVDAVAPSASEHQESLGVDSGDPATEIKAKIAAIAMCDSAAGVNALLASGKEFLKGKNRGDLLGDLMSAAQKRLGTVKG